MEPFFALPIALRAMLAVAPALVQSEADEYSPALAAPLAAPLARRTNMLDPAGGGSVRPPVAPKRDVLDWTSPVFVWVEPGFAYAEVTVAF